MESVAYALGYFIGYHLILVSFLVYAIVGGLASALILWGRRGAGWIIGAWVFGAVASVAFSAFWSVMVQSIFGDKLFVTFLSMQAFQYMPWTSAIAGPTFAVVAIYAMKR